MARNGRHDMLSESPTAIRLIYICMYIQKHDNKEHACPGPHATTAG